MNTHSTGLILTSPASLEASSPALEVDSFVEPEQNSLTQTNEQAHSFESMLHGQLKQKTHPTTDEPNNLFADGEETKGIEALTEIDVSSEEDALILSSKETPSLFEPTLSTTSDKVIETLEVNDHIEAPTVLEGLEGNDHIKNQAVLLDDVMKNSLPVRDTKISPTKPEQNQLSGNTIPTSGKKLPENLTFLSKQAEEHLPINSIAEFSNKAITQSQLFLQSNDSQTALQQNIPKTVLTETPSTVLNIGNLANIEKIVTSLSTSSVNVSNSSSFTIETPVGSPSWSNQVGDRIRWMSKLNMSSAELKLHPAELGTIEIKIYTEDDQTKISFLTNNSLTKELIESSLPKLKDLLNSSGLQLEQSDVSQRDLSENKTFNQNAGSKDNNSNNNNDFDSITQDASSLLVRQRSLNQIDHYV